MTAEKDLRKKYHQYWDNEIADKPETEGYDGSLILDRIYHKMKLEEPGVSSKRKMITRIINIISRVAAIFLIALVTCILVARDNSMFLSNEVACSEIYAPLGTRTMFYLPDGSKGWLNGGSHLQFPSEFRGKTRDVNLQGEAFFNVKTNPKRPFIVSGTDFEVVAHGTSFNILAYPDEKKVKVTLVTGNIQVSGKQNGKLRSLPMLEPDQMCIYDRETSSENIKEVDAAKIISWKEGRLIFRNETFDEVVTKINRWYNVNLMIRDEVLKSYIYLATFEDETLEEVLKLLKLSAPIDFKDLGREIRNDGTFEKRKIEIYYKP